MAGATLASCLPATNLPSHASEPPLDPVAFFAGPTEGSGSLTTITGAHQQLAVKSVGTPLPGGGLSLAQQISLSGEPERDRTWVIRPLGGSQFTGTLTEAVGPVRADVTGNSMTVRYDTRDYAVRQRLVLGADGKLHNRLDIHKWGLNVARLSETITRK
jgi:hypothetical protein